MKGPSQSSLFRSNFMRQNYRSAYIGWRVYSRINATQMKICFKYVIGAYSSNYSLLLALKQIKKLQLSKKSLIFLKLSYFVSNQDRSKDERNYFKQIKLRLDLRSYQTTMLPFNQNSNKIYMTYIFWNFDGVYDVFGGLMRSCSNLLILKINHTLEIINLMSGFNVNCFGQCLNSQEEGGDNPQIFKTKKGRKCLTLVKRGKALLNANNLETNQSTALQQNKVQSRQMHAYHPTTYYTQNRFPIESTRPIQHPHIIYGRYSAGPTVSQINHRYYLPTVTHVQRERRLSEANSASYQARQKSVEERSSSLENKKTIENQQPPKIQVITAEPSNHHFIEIIREQIQNERRSSLFQGAKSILSKLASSHKHTEKHDSQSYVPQTVQKTSNIEIRSFYDNARLCQTQHAINNTHSTIKTQQYEEVSNLQLSRELSIDAIPMSPKSKNISKYKDIKIGKLLGVGKWAHVYLCQQAKTNIIYSFKEIFKQSLQYPVTVERIHENLKFVMSINHPNIISIYSKIETLDKICLIVEYCMRSIYEELKIKGIFSINQIKTYISDLIEGLVYLHQSDRTHGNINIFSTFINFSECKIKPNFTETQEQSSKILDFKSDITSLAIILHEMAYGISNQIANQQMLYEKEKYYKEKQLKKNLINSIKLHLQQMTNIDEKYGQLNAFIMMLLDWVPEVRLTSGICRNHPFLKQDIKF